MTQRIKQFKQPRGGYINPKDLEIITLPIINELNKEENIHASLVGLAVDYLTIFCLNNNIDEGFKISFIGAKNIGEFNYAKIIKSNYRFR